MKPDAIKVTGYEHAETPLSIGHTFTLPPDFASRIGVVAGDRFIQVDETRATFFRPGLPVSIIEPGTLCEFELASGAVVIERYFGPMPEVAEWEKVSARLASMGATFRVVGVAVAIVERAGERGQ